MMYDANATVPVSKVRTLIRRIVTDGQYLKNTNGTWSFDSRAPFQGLNQNATYQSEDQAIDAILGVHFPELLTKAA